MVADPMLRPVSVLPFCLPAYGEDKKLKFLSCQLCQGASVGGWCTDRIIFSQASVPAFTFCCLYVTTFLQNQRWRSIYPCAQLTVQHIEAFGIITK